MKKFFSFFVMLAVATAGFAASRTLKVNAFSEISAAQSLHVKYVNATASGANKVEITGPDGIIDEVSVTLKDSCLQICSTLANIDNERYKDVIITVSAPLATGYKVSSSAEIEIIGQMNLEGKKVKFNASSGGEMECKSLIEASEVVVECESSAEIDFGSVAADNVFVTALSSSEVKVDAINSTRFWFLASSSSEFEIGSVISKSVIFTADSNSEVVLENIDVKDMALLVSSSASFRAAGKVEKASISSNSGAKIQIPDLEMGALTIQSTEGINISGLKVNGPLTIGGHGNHIR